MSIVISQTRATRPTANNPIEFNKKFDEYVHALDNVSVRSNLYEHFIEEMPEDFQDTVLVFDESDFLHEIEKFESFEITTLKGYSFSFVHCENNNLWFMDSQKTGQINDPVFIFSGDFCKEICFYDLPSVLSIYYKNEKIHRYNSSVVAIQSLNHEKPLSDSVSTLSCFAEVDIINQHGTCVFGSFFYALLSDNEIREKFRTASEKLIETGTPSQVPKYILEAITYFETPGNFSKMCYKSNFLYMLFVEAPDTDKNLTYSHREQFPAVMRYFISLYSPYIKISNIDGDEDQDADLVYYNRLENSLMTAMLPETVYFKNKAYEIIGVLLKCNEHQMALSKCQFDPTLWKFHNTYQMESPERFFMFRGTNITFFNENADYKFYFSDAPVLSDTAFYKKKNLNVIKPYEPSDLQKSCEHDFSRMFEQKINGCENIFMQTLLGSIHLRRVLKKSLDQVKNKSIIQKMADSAVQWFDTNERSVCPINLENAVRSVFLSRFAEFKNVDNSMLVPYAFKHTYYNIVKELIWTHENLRRLISKKDANNLLWTVLSKKFDNDKDSTTYIDLAIMLGADPYAYKNKSSHQPIRFCIEHDEPKLYQRMFHAFQLLQPEEALKNTVREFHLAEDETKTLFCDRYATIPVKDPDYTIGKLNDIFGPIVETKEPEKYAALYNVLSKHYVQILNGREASGFFYFFQEPSLLGNRGIIVAGSNLKKIKKVKKSRDSNVTCQQICGFLLFEDYSIDEIQVKIIAGHSIIENDKLKMFESLIAYARANNYKKIFTRLSLLSGFENNYLLKALKILNFQFENNYAHINTAFLIL